MPMQPNRGPARRQAAPITHPVTGRPLRVGTPRDPEPSFAELEQGLAIDQNDLENVCRTHPELVYRASKEFALAESRRDQARQHCKETEAEVEVDIRTHSSDRETKLTDKTVEALRRVHVRVKEANQKLIQADLDMARWLALKDAFNARGYMIRDLIQLYLANYYGSDMERGNRNVRAVNADRTRNALADHRERYDREHS